MDVPFDPALEATAADALAASLEAVEAPPELIAQARDQASYWRARAQATKPADPAPVAPAPAPPGA